jgi:hypothetical protein
MSKHEWRENTTEGDVRLVTATRLAGKWKLRFRLKSEADWTLLDAIPLDDLESLREILWNKYQRRRVPHEHILEVDALIKLAEA